MNWLVTWLVVWTLSVPCPKAPVQKQDVYGRGTITRYYNDCREQKTKQMSIQLETLEDVKRFITNGKLSFDFGRSYEWLDDGYSNLKYDTGSPNDNIIKCELKDFTIIPLSEGAKKQISDIKNGNIHDEYAWAIDYFKWKLINDSKKYDFSEEAQETNEKLGVDKYLEKMERANKMLKGE